MTDASNAKAYAYSVPTNKSEPHGRLDLRSAGGPLIAYDYGRAEIVSEPKWDLNALEKLPPADQIDYITDRLAADFKNKTPNVGTAILMLRNVAEELREVPTGG